MSETSRALQAIKDLKHIHLEGLRFRLIDARGQVVGRLAQQIATILQGKDKPIYNPKKNYGDVVVVINAAHVHFTHDKWNTKLYRWHTGYPGGLRARTATDQWEYNPTKILWTAVNGMLPKNQTRTPRLDKLKIFPEAEHPFTEFPLIPFVPPVKMIKQDAGLGWQVPEGFQPVNKERYGLRVFLSPRLQGRARPVLDIQDLLTEEERRALEAQQQAKQLGQQQPGQKLQQGKRAQQQQKQ